jgi:hypothetical protein
MTRSPSSANLSFTVSSNSDSFSTATAVICFPTSDAYSFRDFEGILNWKEATERTSVRKNFEDGTDLTSTFWTSPESRKRFARIWPSSTNAKTISFSILLSLLNFLLLFCQSLFSFSSTKYPPRTLMPPLSRAITSLAWLYMCSYRAQSDSLS